MLRKGVSHIMWFVLAFVLILVLIVISVLVFQQGENYAVKAISDMIGSIGDFI